VSSRALFDGLSSGLQKAWDLVRIDGKLSEENMKAPMREIRRALLEADVSLPVVRAFVGRVQEKALGTKVCFSNGNVETILGSRLS
jgi:signal recognition particle subunit SRP54